MNRIKSMFTASIVCFISLALLSCASTSNIPEQSRVFYSNGKAIKFSESQLMMLRERLDKQNLNTEDSKLSVANQDYIKDYLAINELMLSKNAQVMT